jgi:hypothetical protein
VAPSSILIPFKDLGLDTQRVSSPATKGRDGGLPEKQKQFHTYYPYDFRKMGPASISFSWASKTTKAVARD